MVSSRCFLLVVWAPFVVALDVANCTQQVLALPGARAAASVQGRYALFALQAHADDNNTGHVYVFDGSTRAWSETRMSASRTNMCATSWRHKAIFAGGTAGRGLPKSASVDIFDTSTGTWSLHNLSIGRDLLGCASAGNITVFAGGSAPQANQSETASVEVLNHVTGEWALLARGLSVPRKKPEAVAVGDSIVIAGGEVAKSVVQGRFRPRGPRSGPGTARPTPAAGGLPLGSYTASVDVLDAASMTWSNASRLASPRQYFGAARVAGSAVTAAVGAGAEGAAIFAGGFWDDVRLADVDVFSPATGRHGTRYRLSHNRSNLNAASAGGGRYAAFGSGNIDAAAKITLDFFDGETGEWASATGHAPTTMNGVAAVGSAVLFAGFDGRYDTFALDGDCSMFAGRT
eukprot:g7493.t1